MKEYYSLQKLLSYNAQYNIVLSERGIGKSYGTKLFLMQQPGTAMCLYRTSVDMTTAISSWIEPLLREGYAAEDFEFTTLHKSGRELLYQGKVKIYFRALTQANTIKQEIFPDDLNWIWLDEFIPLVYRRLAGVESEGDAIRTIVKTVDHDADNPRQSRGLKPVRVLMYGNPFTWDNPILSYFHVDPSRGYGIHRAGPGVVWDLVEPKTRRKSDAEITLGDDIHKNQSWKNELDFIRPLPKGARPAMSLRIGNEYFLLYNACGATWVTSVPEHRGIRAGNRDIRFGSISGLKEEELAIDGTTYHKNLQRMTDRGRVFFPDINTKWCWINSLSTLRLKR